MNQERRKYFKDMQARESNKADTVSEIKDEMNRTCVIKRETINLKLQKTKERRELDRRLDIIKKQRMLERETQKRLESQEQDFCNS